MAVSTGFVKVAQSGKTIDGREIKPAMLLDAAETYDTETYTASVFPDHDNQMQSYGTVKALMAQTESNGEVALFADIQPNAFWQSDARYGQNLFTSIAVIPNFAGTGKWYMYSLAATNNPASLGVQKLEFSKREPEALFSAVFDTKQAESTSEPTETQVKSVFNWLFKKSTTQDNFTMSEKQELKELQEKFTALETKLSADTKAAEFTALKTEHDALKAEFASLKAERTVADAKHDALMLEFTALKTTLDDALKEQPGTKSFASTGAAGSTADDAANYV